MLFGKLLFVITIVGTLVTFHDVTFPTDRPVTLSQAFLQQGDQDEAERNGQIS